MEVPLLLPWRGPHGGDQDAGGRGGSGTGVGAAGGLPPDHGAVHFSIFWSAFSRAAGEPAMWILPLLRSHTCTAPCLGPKRRRSP